MNIQSGDLVVLGEKNWKVLGFHLGAAGMESVVELATQENLLSPSAHGRTVGMYVPIDLIRELCNGAGGCGLYRRAVA